MNAVATRTPAYPRLARGVCRDLSALPDVEWCDRASRAV